MRILSLFLILAVCLAACGLPSATPTAIPTATFTPIPTLTPTSSSPQEPAPGFALPTYEPAQVAYDFATNMCAATWGNGSTWFSVCPASRSDAAGGFYAFLDQPGIESNVATNAPAILILPSQRAVFGKYPPFTVQAGDAFHAILACEGDAPCDVEFALEYYDQNGTYHPNARDGAWPLEWHHAAGEGPEPILVDLSNLAGQTATTLVEVDGGGPAASVEGLQVGVSARRGPDQGRATMLLDGQPVPAQIGLLSMATKTPESNTKRVMRLRTRARPPPAGLGTSQPW